MQETRIGNCSRLSRVVLPASLNRVHYRIFEDCPALKGLEVDAANPRFRAEGPFLLSRDGTILHKALPNVAGDVAVPEGVREIRKGAFLDCAQIRSLVLPDSVESLGENAFLDCGELQAITFGGGLKKINQWAFCNCGCTGLVLPDGLKQLEPSAFEGCHNLKRLYIPASAEVLFNPCENRGFCPNSEALHIEVAPGNPWLRTEGPFLLDCWGDLLWAAPLEVGEEVVIPEEVTGVAFAAFAHGTTVRSVAFPSGLKNINAKAFADCKNLEEITFQRAPVFISDSAFDLSHPMAIRLLEKGPADGNFSDWLKKAERAGCQVMV